MSDLPVQHYLKLYQLRVSMAERGVTSPPPDLVSSMRHLIAGLSAQPPDAGVRLEMEGNRTRFIAATTGELLGEFNHTNNA